MSNMKTIRIATHLRASADIVWPAVKTPQAFVHVARGMLRYPAAERLDRPWQVGDQISGRTFLFGLLPFSHHHLTVSSIDNDNHVLVSDERGGAIRAWRHDLIVTPIDDTSCTYEDVIEFDAGLLTPVVAAYATLFYRHRQRRWRQLAPLLRAVADASEANPSARPGIAELDAQPIRPRGRRGFGRARWPRRDR